MSQIKPKNLNFMERQVFKVVAPMLGVTYALYKLAGGDMDAERYAKAVKDDLNGADFSDEFQQHLKDYSDYMQKGN